LSELLPFSVSILGNNLVEFGNRQGDKFIIGIILGPVALGYYVLGYRLYRTLNMLLTGFVSQVTVSSFSALQNDSARLLKSYLALTRVAASVAFPVFAIAAALAPGFIPELLGNKWESSIVVFQILCLVGALECVSFFNGSVMIALGKPHWKFGIGLVNFVLNTLGFILFAKLGIMYVAIVYTVRAYIVSPLPLILIRKLINLRIRDFLNGLAFAFFAALCLYVFCTKFSVMDFLPENFWVKFVITVVSGLIMYAVLVLKFDKILLDNLIQIVGKVKGKPKGKS
jgi:PST family polysaccharide transporter